MRKLLISLSSFLSRVIHSIYVGVAISIFLIVLFIDKNLLYENEMNSLLPNWALFIIGLCCVILGVRYFHKHIHITFDEKRIKRVLIVVSLVLMLIQFIGVYSFYFYTGWDAKTIRDAAFLFLEHPHRIPKEFFLYYSYHVNQIFITIIYGNLFRYFNQLGVGNVYLSALIVNVICVNLSGLLISLATMKLTKKKYLGIITWIIFTLMFQFSPWVSIPYSDTYGMIIAVLIFYVYVHNMQRQNPIYWYLIGLLSIIGYYIKPQAMIVLIAIVIYEILRYFSFTTKLKFYHLLMSGLLLFLSINHALDYYLRLSYTYDFGIIYGRAFTYTHYLMTGLNPERYGIYLDSDAVISYQTGTVEEREAANWEVIKTRLANYGVFGYIDFFTRKLLVNYNDGTFAWFGEGGFIVERFEDRTFLSPLLKELFYDTGSLYRYYQTWSQFVWILVLFLIGVIAIDKKNFRQEYILLFLIFIGSFVFIQLFEARARYLIISIPFFAALAAIGLNIFYDSLVRPNSDKKSIH